MEKTLASFVEISKAINSLLDIDELLETIMDAAITAVGVERGVLFLKDGDGALLAKAARNVERETLENATEISRSITTEVASSGRYFLSSNVQDDPNTMGRDSVKEFKILSILCVPLADKDSIIGKVTFDDHGQNIVPLITKYVVQDGKWVVWEDSEYASGKRTLTKK